MLDRFQPVRVSVVMVSIAAAGPFVLADAHSFEMGIVAAVCLGFGSGGETDVIPYLLSRYFGLRSLSTLYGLNGRHGHRRCGRSHSDGPRLRVRERRPRIPVP